GDVLSLDTLLAVLITNGEADAALLHEAQKQLLLGLPVPLPHPFRQLRAAKAPMIAFDLLEALRRAVEYGIDGIECPRLVEDDLFTEQPLAIEHRAGVVKVIEQKLGLTDPPFARALDLGAQVEIALMRDEPLPCRQLCLESGFHGGAARP